jgi:hypothetical protein
VQYDVATSHRALEVGWMTDVALDRVRTSVEQLLDRPARPRQIVQDPYRPAPKLQQTRREMGADESGTAGYQAG